MHIALLVSAIQPHQKESLAITTLNFSKNLVLNGKEVTIVSRNKWNLPTYEKKDGVAFYRTKKIGKSVLHNKLLAFPLAVRKLSKINKIDVLHSFSSSPLLVLRSILAKKFFARKALIVHTLKSYPIKKDINAKGGNKYLSKLGDASYKLLNHADIITVPTNVFAEKLYGKGVKKEKIKLVKTHLDLNKFFPQNKEKLKKKYGYFGKKIVLNYGAMWEIKGTDYLIKSIPLIVKENPNVLFIFAPRNLDQAKEKYLPMIKKLQVEDHVQFIENDIVIEEYVNLADLVAIPYPHLEGTEGTPSCLLEALACGTPIVTTELPELMEVFSNCAVFVKPKNVVDLAKGIFSVFNNDNFSIVNVGLEKISDFDIDKITEKFIKLYDMGISEKMALS